MCKKNWSFRAKKIKYWTKKRLNKLPMQIRLFEWAKKKEENMIQTQKWIEGEEDIKKNIHA